MYIIQDIETIPETEIQFLREEEIKKDPSIDPTGFPPIQYHKVISIGMLALKDNYHPVKGGCAAGGLSAPNSPSEHQMITRWAEAVANKDPDSPPHTLVDWNGRAFDMPVLQTRAFALGIPLPWYFSKPNNNKYAKPYRDRFGGKHIDLAQDWTNFGSFRKPSLLHLASLMGLPGKVGIDGSLVYKAYQDALYEEIDTYCMQDVIQTAFIFQRFAHIKGELDHHEYQQAAKALLEFTATIPNQETFLTTINQDKLLLR